MSSSKKKPWQLLAKLAASEATDFAKKINEITSHVIKNQEKKQSLVALIANYSQFQPKQPISLIRNQLDFRRKLEAMVLDIDTMIKQQESERNDLISQWKVATARESGFQKLNESEIQIQKAKVAKIDQQFIDERAAQTASQNIASHKINANKEES